jgi:hypothetical protein
MAATLPFLTAYDPPGTSEGTLDPLGLYQIADQLAVQLVPAVRERMQRIRFLTAMAVGALVTEGLDDDPRLRDSSPYLVWEWLVVEALMRSKTDDGSVWGVPGTLVAQRALNQHGYLDARSYLKTPRIFGFHGVYKRLATHLGMIDVHLGAGPNAEKLVDAWARGLGLGGIEGAKPLLSQWSSAVKKSLGEHPPRTKPGWAADAWLDLANAFAPETARTKERRCIRDLLLSADNRRLGAFPALWKLQADFDANTFCEEQLHNRLEQLEPEYGPLLAAIRAYEGFARSMQDAFDLLRSVAAGCDSHGFPTSAIRDDADFVKSIHNLHERFEAAHHALAVINLGSTSLPSLFDERFGAFAGRMDVVECARNLCTHHEAIQRAKSADGKRSWFDRLGQDRIYIRHTYRIARPTIQPDRYLHDYRGWPIRRFYTDLA